MTRGTMLGQALQAKSKKQAFEESELRRAKVSGVTNWDTEGITCQLEETGEVVYCEARASGAMFDLSANDYVWVRRLVGDKQNKWFVIGFCETSGGSFVPPLRPAVATQISELYASDEDPQAVDCDADGNTTVLVGLILDDGDGDSPKLQFVGGSNDDTIELYLDDDATGGDSDLVLKLADAAGDSKLSIIDSGDTEIFHVNSDGMVHLALSSTPASPVEGDIYADADHNLYYYNGTGWDDLTAGGGTGLWTDDGAYIYPDNYGSFVITDAGKVAIGATSPLEELDVRGTVFIDSGDYDGSYGRSIKIGYAADADIHHSIQTTVSSTAANNGLRFYLHGGTSDDNQVLVMHMGGDGTVGIGTTSPARLLHVDGEVRLTPQADPPGSAAEGDLYADTDNDLYYYNGSEWKSLTAGGGTGLWSDQGTYIDANNASNVVVTDTERLGAGTTSPLGKIDATQSSSSGAIPPLYLYQADVDQDLIRFRGTAAASSLTNSIVAEAEVTTATRAGFLKVYVQDDGGQITDQMYFMPIFTLA